MTIAALRRDRAEDAAPTDPVTLAEQAVLGGLLLDNSARERINGLGPEHFASDQHRIIFAAILDQLDDGEDGAADAVTVYGRLARAGKDEDAGGLLYLNALAQNTPSAANVHAYAEAVQRAAAERRVRGLLAEAQIAADRGDLSAAVRLASKAAEEAPIAEGAEDEPELLDIAHMAATEPEPPQFVVADWMPEGQATLFAGHGGAGKSLIALTAAVCIALGRGFFGQPCKRRRVLFESYEDTEQVLHYRLRRICNMLGVDMASLVGWLHLSDATEHGEPLFAESRDGLVPTSALEKLRKRVKRTRAEVLILDGTADAFDGNENARAQVRKFVRALRRLMPATGAVMLLHHLDAASAHSGSSKGYSGSTAWHNSCRARWALRLTEQGDDADSSRVTIELRKSNYGGRPPAIELRFNEVAGCFVSDATMPATPAERKDKETADRDAVLAIVKAADADGDPLPTAKRGDRTAYEVATARGSLPPSLTTKRGKTEFYKHLEALRQGKAIRVDGLTRPNRNKVEVYRPAAFATERASTTEQPASATEQTA